MELALATGNQGKRREIAALLAPWGVSVRLAKELGFAQEVPETGSSFLENASHKARVVARALERPALADDSGLVVDALGGRPGVHSARYAGLQADDQANNRKLLAEMASLPAGQRGAAFVCVMVCALPNGKTISSQGRLAGRIALAPAGQSGFGYDPVFELPRRGLTVAQLSAAEKNRISHRARALAALLPRLKEFLGLRS
jgi:XTP/dITP diphosphohydrolase